MRATSTRRLVGGAAAGLLLAATFFGTTAPVLGAVPTGAAKNEAIPAQFTAGNEVGFRATFDQLDNGSTLAKLFLALNTTGTSSNDYVSAVRGGKVVAGCTKGLPVTCTFKSVRPGEHIVVTAAFTVAPDTSTVTGDGIWSTTGSSTRDAGDNSHGDTWADPNGVATATLTTDTNFGGGFSIAADSAIANGQTVTALNRQATKVAGLSAGVAATVLDGATATGDCGPYDCSSAIGEWSVVSVGDGQSFGTPFQIVITYYQGTPKSFVHQYVDSNGVTQYELVGACPKKDPASGAPCFVWNSKLGQATIYTFHNGSWKGL